MPSLSHPFVSRLVRALRDRHGYKVLVETGTFTGTSTMWAANEFDWVVSIDKMDTHEETARARCTDPSLRCYPLLLRGDSRVALVPVVEALDAIKQPAIFYLDAHDINNLYGGGNDCPVLLELHTIMMADERHAVLIDDAHDFCSPPIPEYPSLAKIVSYVHNGHQLRVAHDLIVIVPDAAIGAVDAFVAERVER